MANRAFNPVIYRLPDPPESSFSPVRQGVTYNSVAPQSYNHPSKDDLWVVTGTTAEGYLNTPLTREYGAEDVVNRKNAVTLLPKNAYYSADTEPLRYIGAIGTSVYLFGSSGIWVFDLTTLKYTALEVTQSADRTYGTACVVGTKIYLFGGIENGVYCKNVKIFDTATNTFATVDGGFSDRYSYGCTHASAVAVGTKIYIIGGMGKNGSSTVWYDILSGIAVFDTTTNTCTHEDVS